MLNPNQGYKKIVQKLKARYKVRLPVSNQIILNSSGNASNSSKKKPIDEFYF